MNFIKVREAEHYDELYLNLDTIVAIYPNLKAVLTNGIATAGPDTTQLIYRFDDKNMQIILNAIDKKILNE